MKQIPKNKHIWPDDAVDTIVSMNANGFSWSVIARHFGVSLQTVIVFAKNQGVYQHTRLKWYYTAFDDKVLREDYSSGVDLELTAKKLGRSVGSLRQRLIHKHRDLIGTTGRNSRTIKAQKRFGFKWPEQSVDVEGFVDDIIKKTLDAIALARTSVLKSKINLRDRMLKQMLAEIAEGKDRNQAIFEYRSFGLGLNEIADVFGISRERVRQIFDKEAFRRATELVEQDDKAQTKTTEEPES